MRDLSITYPILSDSARRFILEYGVLHPQENIARPSLFVIDREGAIRWQYVGTSAPDRPPIEIVLQQLRAIQ